MEIVVHSKKSLSIKVSKEIEPFPQEYPFKKCDVKNDPIGHPELDKKIRLPVLSEIRLHPKTPDSATLVSTKAVICAVVAIEMFPPGVVVAIEMFPRML